MEYIIFLITIQVPFVYFMWRVFQNQQSRLLMNLRMLENRLKKTQNLIEALRVSAEKTSNQLERDLEKTRALYALSETRLNQLEKYTGLRNKDFSQSSLLKDKEFTL